MGWFSDSDTIWFFGGVGWWHALADVTIDRYQDEGAQKIFICVSAVTIICITGKGDADHDLLSERRHTTSRLDGRSGPLCVYVSLIIERAVPRPV